MPAYLPVYAAALAFAVAVVALALTALARTTGVFLLETVAASMCFALFLVTPTHMDAEAPKLLMLGLLAVLTACLLLPWYRRVRTSLGGDSFALIFSYAVLNVLIVAMTLMSGGTPVPTGRLRADISLAIWCTLVCVLCGLIFGLIRSCLWCRGNLAALLLARDDDRVLRSFGCSGPAVRYGTLLAATAVATSGVLLFISTQDLFGPTHSNEILMPAFSVALATPAIRARRTVLVAGAIVLVCVYLTQATSPLLGAFYQGCVFASVAVAPAIKSSLTVSYTRLLGPAKYIRRCKGE